MGGHDSSGRPFFGLGLAREVSSDHDDTGLSVIDCAECVVATLNERWKDYGTIWAQVVESETLPIQIPQEPLTRNCLTPSIQSPR